MLVGVAAYEDTEDISLEICRRKAAKFFMMTFADVFTCCLHNVAVRSAYRGRIQRKTLCMGTYAGGDYNPTLCPLQIRF
jgi:hypothetical protein